MEVSGPGVAINVQAHPECIAKDLDRDGDVDGNDYALFQLCMSGTNLAPAGCTGGVPASGTYTLHGLPADVLPDGHVLIFARARHYDPQLGRWLQRDPLGYVDGPNLYEAFGGNALVHTDPSGEVVWFLAIAAGFYILDRLADDAVAPTGAPGEAAMLAHRKAQREKEQFAEFGTLLLFPVAG